MAASLAVLSAADKEQGTFGQRSVWIGGCVWSTFREGTFGRLSSHVVLFWAKMDASPAIAFQTTVVIVYEAWKTSHCCRTDDGNGQ